MRFDRTGEQMNAKQCALLDKPVDCDIGVLDGQPAALLAWPLSGDAQDIKVHGRTALHRAK